MKVFRFLLDQNLANPCYRIMPVTIVQWFVRRFYKQKKGGELIQYMVRFTDESCWSSWGSNSGRGLDTDPMVTLKTTEHSGLDKAGKIDVIGTYFQTRKSLHKWLYRTFIKSFQNFGI